MRLKSKLLTYCLAIGCLPAILLGLVTIYKSQQAIEEHVYAQLNSVRSIKSNQISRYLNKSKTDVKLAASLISQKISENNNQLTQ